MSSIKLKNWVHLEIYASSIMKANLPNQIPYNPYLKSLFNSILYNLPSRPPAVVVVM